MPSHQTSLSLSMLTMTTHKVFLFFGKEKHVMDCCQCQGIEAKFDQKYVTKKLDKYRQQGPKETTRQLIEALRAEGVEGMTLLDIGGGVGDIQHELLKSGVRTAINNEASTAYVEACRAEAERQGHADRVRHLQGNSVDLAAEVPPADIVTLDRVICCYHDMERMVNLSSQKARRLYGLVYPRDKWWVKIVVLIYYNVRHWIQRNPFRNYVHPTEAVEAVVRKNGLERTFIREMGPWQVVVFTRT
ncbi:MAG: hypothetical protein E3J21_26220 [Anaerolineales bacterium]|nr:MAG: hypothetical protein E3J21_26220 [Anaerolineales bacterium]